MIKIINYLKDFLNYSSSKNKNNFGYIEFITYGEVNGWAYSQDSTISYIGIFLGKELITYSRFNVIRNDIKEKFNIDFSTGFRILFDYKMGRKLNKGEPKICALDQNKKIIFKLKFIGNLKNSNLNKIFYNPYFGSDGRLDGINSEGTISGWASKRGYRGKFNIWLQSDKAVDPEKINCSIWRQDLEYFKVEDCGFEINPLDISPEYDDSNIWFSFDKEGKFNIDPTNKKVKLRLQDYEIQDGAFTEKQSQEFIVESQLYKDQKETLNNFRLLLDGIEVNK